MTFRTLSLAVAAVATFAGAAATGSGPRLAALAGLAPFAALENTAGGRAALAANFTVTAAVHDGTAGEPALEPFDAQQRRALADATITSANGTELADGLGTSLGDAYRRLANCTSLDDGRNVTCTSVAPSVATLFAYASRLSGADSAAAKFFFGNATDRVDGAGAGAPIAGAEAAIMRRVHGTPDVYGRAYRLPAGIAGADPFGDSRPFQTETGYANFSAPDFFGVTASSRDYLQGPAQRLVDSPSFPSGHTTYGYTESLVFAMLIPERYPQMIARAAEYGDHRIVIGAHYAMDVIAGRTLAYYDLAHVLAADPAYLGLSERDASITDIASALARARTDLRGALVRTCGAPLARCAGDDRGRFATPASDDALCAFVQTYGLAPVAPERVAAVEDVATLAPDAGYLLTTAFPALSLAQADDILTRTEGPGGGFLDDGSAFGLYSRLNLYRAATAAASNVTARGFAPVRDRRA